MSLKSNTQGVHHKLAVAYPSAYSRERMWRCQEALREIRQLHWAPEAQNYVNALIFCCLCAQISFNDGSERA